MSGSSSLELDAVLLFVVPWMEVHAEDLADEDRVVRDERRPDSVMIEGCGTPFSVQAAWTAATTS
jgi:hypothetical protein